MAFVSGNGRTWDPDTGWELVSVEKVAGLEKFRLSHPERDIIEFSGDYFEALKLPETNALGKHLVLRRFELYTWRTNSSMEVEKQKELIKQALTAFGIVYNGPIGPVEIVFDIEVDPL